MTFRRPAVRSKAKPISHGAIVGGLALVVLAAMVPDTAEARPRLPEIRLSETNQVPACVTPERLMAFVRSRNKNRKILRRYHDIAHWFKVHGERLKVRWDYAFFQSMIETNYLIYRTGSGRWGDVALDQNNFAGIGTTGGGVPGNKFPDVKTGVLAQMQHLIAYSGTYPKNPVAARTRLKQGEIVNLSRKLNRKVRFDDLAGRWAVDRKYADSIEWVAKSYRKKFCTGEMLLAAEAEARKTRQAEAAARAKADAAAERIRLAAIAAEKRKQRQAQSAIIASKAIANAKKTGDNRLSALGAANIAARGAMMPPPPANAAHCQVMQASYGGRKTLLIRAAGPAAVTYTALQVLAGFERSMADNYIKEYARGGMTIGEFATQKEALSKAFALCPGK